MCMIDLEPAEVWRETNRTARKEHRCSCCQRGIYPGERYMVHFSVFEGSATSEKCCGQCESDRADFANAHDGTLCTPGFLVEMLSECISEEPESKETWQPMLDRMMRVRRARRGAVSQ